MRIAFFSLIILWSLPLSAQTSASEQLLQGMMQKYQREREEDNWIQSQLMNCQRGDQSSCIRYQNAQREAIERRNREIQRMEMYQRYRHQPYVPKY
ncbi:hypothetical protein [Candidatus Accumulibacter vicinus]|uniref:Uncharacterized protein n=1 Tax=Candidatus Accumulibacter vicinus TaxID=2954382 RepID=A0A084Y092_9PROT|nr:hypothetical protein [Candidatus Accumulibacter vicinus]KFB68136.1 MAG: hypothetical protein CAPSK01_001988 [Candidatus Accumulibacter vicinus]